MAQTRELTYPLQFSTPQLAYLLGMVHAQNLIGGDDAALFPADPDQRQAQWDQGLAELQADQWIVWDETAGHYSMTEPLMMVIATLAEPDIVVVSEWHAHHSGHQGVSHYFSPSGIIEMSLVGSHYTLVALTNTEVMTERLAHSLGYKELDQPDLGFNFPRELVEQAKQYPDPRWLAQQGLAPEAAQYFAETLQATASRGTVTVLRTLEGKAIGMRLVGALIGAGGQQWLALPHPNQTIDYFTATTANFMGVTSSMISELLNTPIEELVAG
ncbi:MAG TPA: hypothetical protein DEF47_09230 [Herpetosiphon sp.]|uniref:Uncharacterized protein n=1 Tax=Herpetosiphon aurantiacus (strain ATCC 23779 / DSM 785 / 114-95) TaxID=316274 RepID=A9B719_HERA2|nr:hypothetical protein [Herpetosiphon sp.]ABX05887.1 hypothetical protein Haur_3250 [Herpetosiphon aurantiacus DSM 785]HBW50075.1 hypothetical protein [Herpetosiphon sp.]